VGRWHFTLLEVILAVTLISGADGVATLLVKYSSMQGILRIVLVPGIMMRC